MSAIPSGASFDPARRAFFGYVAYVAGGIPFLATAWGFGGERCDTTLKKSRDPDCRFAGKSDSRRIVQLSDIHIGAFMPRSYRDIRSLSRTRMQ
jgi:hypothetical protein